MKYFQTLVDKSKDAIDKLTTQTNQDHKEFVDCTEVSQSQMTEQIDNVTEWSQCMSCELNRRSTDVQNFLLEELKKDVPTGCTTDLYDPQ